MNDYKKVILYGYFDLKTGECIYIGIDTTDKLERWQEHTKPAKKYEQEINTWIQDRVEGEDWVLITLFELNCYIEEDAKKAIHILESFYTEKYKPKMNVYKK